MKPRVSNHKTAALTLLEVLVVVFTIAVLGVMFLPVLARAKKKSSRIGCVNCLKQVGLAFRIWTGDNGDKFPMEVSVKNGGVMELVAKGNAVLAFQVMSNELSTPKIVFCPNDEKHSFATNFNSDFTSKKTSYFVGLNASINFPNSILSGDDNFEREGRLINPGVYDLTTNELLFWSPARHNRSGNVVLVDGSVHSLRNSDLVSQFSKTGLATNRLAIP